MYVIDTAILIVIVLSCVFGFWRGFVAEVLALLTWLAALWVAYIYSEDLSGSELLVNVIENSSVRLVAVYAVIFMVVMLLGGLLNQLLSKLFTMAGSKLADRVLGGVFGLVRGVIIVMVILFISNAFLSVSGTEQWRQSTLVPHGMDMIERSRMFITDIYTGNLSQ